MRVSEMIGKPMVSADTGEKVGSVIDVLLDATRHHVVGVLISDGVLAKQRVLPFADVRTIGVDAVIATTLTSLCDARDWVDAGRPVHRSQTVHGKDVVTSDGARIGKVRDLVADESTGNVVALEIATGARGARPTRPATVHTLGSIQLINDVVVIPDDVANTRTE